MYAKVRPRVPALLCALLLPLCALIVRPVVETGISDDWSYDKTVQILARTGHIAYNGWATAMLGWQLYLGALFVKLFGFSFTAVRASTLLTAVLTAYLLERTLERAGIRPWNAAIGTLTIVLSPLSLVLTFSFMTDISGMFCTVLCLYACIRALELTSDRATLLWISFAALSNAIGGSARQIAWLGVLVMVPTTLWMLRKRASRNVLAGGAVACAVGFAIVFSTLHWFQAQPYSIPEPIFGGGINVHGIKILLEACLRGPVAIASLLLPAGLMFLPALRASDRRQMRVLATCSALAAVFVAVLWFHGIFADWLLPYFSGTTGIVGPWGVKLVLGDRPVILPEAICVVWTAIVVVSLLALIAFFFPSAGSTRPVELTPPDGGGVLPVRDLVFLITPYFAAYTVLLVNRTAKEALADRYLLPLAMLLLFPLLLLYQQRVAPRLPAAAFAVITIYAAYGVASMHDFFVMYRARFDAIQQLRASGIPAISIDVGPEYNGWNEIEQRGFLNEPRIRIPAGAYLPAPAGKPVDTCDPFNGNQYPSLKPLYTLSFQPTGCAGLAGFAPVTYRTWLLRKPTTIYTLKYGGF